MGSTIVWEVVMRKDHKVRNFFFNTLDAAYKKYHEYHSLGWAGEVFRTVIEY